MANYNTSTEQGKCIFCEIANGNLHTPGIFWEDENYMAFLSTWPSVEGFTVVIPKAHHYSDVLAMDDDHLKNFILAAKKVSQILLNGFEDVGRVGLVMEGTGVNHAHIKLIPMHGTDHMKNGDWKQYHSGKSNYYDKYEGFLVSADGPKADPVEIQNLADRLKYGLPKH